MTIFRAHTPAFKDMKGENIKNSIAEMQMVPLGNTKQSVIIRGEDPSRKKLLQGEFMKADLSKTIKKVEIPVYFFLGRHDYQAASVVTERFFHEIVAPKKELIWFEQSAHCACFEESEKFNSLMVNMVLNTTTSKL